MAVETLKNIYVPEAATLVKVERMTGSDALFEFKLDSGRELGHRPGQFVEITVPGIGEAPISVSSSPRKKGSFELGVRRVGNVTGALHRLGAGAKVGVRGPYGSHIPVDGEMLGKDLLFIAGGCGLMPLRSAIHYVLEARADYGRVDILFGCRTPQERLYVNELDQWAKRNDVNLRDTVDKAEGDWRGNVGVITTLLPQVKTEPSKTIALVVGPPVMYKFVLWDLLEMNIPEEQIYISLERRMKCGVGKCGHCQINGLTACQDGPVFRYADVKNAKEVLG